MSQYETCFTVCPRIQDTSLYSFFLLLFMLFSPYHIKVHYCCPSESAALPSFRMDVLNCRHSALPLEWNIFQFERISRCLLQALPSAAARCCTIAVCQHMSGFVNGTLRCVSGKRPSKGWCVLLFWGVLLETASVPLPRISSTSLERNEYVYETSL